ncbi:hypothetical protein [Pseudomonas sp. CC6-YY-74]|uniref:hypothetical protein n=1 Tax=Pseudomonas sp. CC6-YY-74 TaxID=1930532 RepID=UPI0009A15851|nr:hypothetical protein [Pseudomonas sp. CC6-YY-74]
MPFGLAGSGTKEAPWLITTNSEFLSVVTAIAYAYNGYYKATGDLSASLPQGTPYGTSLQYYTSTCKVIDMCGYKASFFCSNITTGHPLIFGLMLRNGDIYCSIYGNPSNYYNDLVLIRSTWFTDCIIRITHGGAYRSYFATYAAGHITLEPKVNRRVFIMGVSLSASYNYFLDFYGTDSGETTSADVVRFATSTGTWYNKISVVPTVAQLDAFTGTGHDYTMAAWFFSSEGYPRPYFADVLALSVSSLVDGVVKKRPLFWESQGAFNYLGETGEDGAIELNLRIQRWTTLRLVASETHALSQLQEGGYVSAGVGYLPPFSGTGYKYVAGSAGQMIGLTSTSFGGAPVTVNGVTLTPVPVYREAYSDHTSLLSAGPQQIITLDTVSSGGGGGGPVIDGDPAYLDGVVEEIHPMLGTVRALINAEVLVFEKRATGYVAMGSAYSNAVGEFRVNTEVYGGGDIFAFAADFPGFVWQPGIELEVGSRIRPTVNNGYVYEVVTAGNSGATEPTWWADAGDGTEGAIGGATAKARPYYQPVGHGPLKMTLVE